SADNQPHVSVNNVVLPTVDHARDLGVYVSKDLKFGHRVSQIVRSAHIKACNVHKAFVSNSPEFMVQMFKTFVRSKLEYCSPVWSPHLRKDVNAIENIQRRFTKRIAGLWD